MSKWTITEYSQLPTDGAGNVLPIFNRPRASAGAVAAGTVNISQGTRYIRFVGDTAAHVAIGAAAATSDPYVPAGAEFLVAVDPRFETQLTFIAG